MQGPSVWGAIENKRKSREQTPSRRILLRQFRGVAFIRGVDLEGILANLALPAIFAEHVFHEPDDES
jgi:hypothetical protein